MKDARYRGHFFLRCVPKTTKIAFKAACAETNMTMRDVLLLLMRKYASAVRRKRRYIKLSDIYRLDADDNNPEI